MVLSISESRVLAVRMLLAVLEDAEMVSMFSSTIAFRPEPRQIDFPFIQRRDDSGLKKVYMYGQLKSGDKFECRCWMERVGTDLQPKSVSLQVHSREDNGVWREVPCRVEKQDGGKIHVTLRGRQ